jgi:glycosyltransferase involved in cell wall biosynthesis
MTRKGQRPRVLVFAYACEPGRGSEPGAGWGIVRALDRFADCTVLAGPEHTGGILRRSADQTSAAITFVEVPEPVWGKWAKGHRTTWFLLYLAWLRSALRVAQELHTAQPFQLVYHATYSAYWLPSPIARFDVPSVWGPVGGAVVTPLQLWPSLGPRGVMGEVLDLLAVRTLAWLPATRRTWAAATVRIVQNEDTLSRLPATLRPNTYVLNHAPLVEMETRPRRARRPEVVSLCALDNRKGVNLAIRGLTHTPEETRLVLAGDGPQRKSLEALAHKLGVAHRVEFRGRVDRAEVFRLLEGAAAAVFVGLREEGGIALAEAMLIGIPVIVLSHGGARTIALGAIDPARVALVTPDRTETVARQLGEAMTRFSRRPWIDAGPNLDPAHSLSLLEAVCLQALQAPGSSAGASKRAIPDHGMTPSSP